MDKQQISALLGRPLTSYEDTNFNLYIKIAKQNLGSLLCSDICNEDDPRIYEARDGYSTVFTDIFVEIQEVKLNGEVTNDYVAKQWDSRNASWYNSIVFDRKLCDGDEIEVSATWGFEDCMPEDLQQVLAGLFDLITKKNKSDASIQSKQVEDFRITFRDINLDESFHTKFGNTLAKYSLCGISDIRHGRTGKC